MEKGELTKRVWSKEKYYELAGKGSSNFNHPAMKELLRISGDAKKILDLGCGEGTRLSKVVKSNQEGYGIDISEKAILLAKRKFPHLKFTVGDLEKLPFENKSFDLVYSAFVFEHLDNPKKVITEAARVLKKNGKLLIVAPNFGAPNRASPPFKGNRFSKLFEGFLKDIFPVSDLGWLKVEPIADSEKYEMDWDTVIEPYLGSLIRYLIKSGLTIKYKSSSWEEEVSDTGLLQKKIKWLGELGVYPFKFWGPHLVVVAEKQES